MARFKYTNINDPLNPVREHRDIVESDPVKVEDAFNAIPGVAVEPGSLVLESMASSYSYGGGFLNNDSARALVAAGTELALPLDVATWFQYYFEYDAGAGEFTFTGQDGETLPVRIEAEYALSIATSVTFDLLVNGVPGATFVKASDGVLVRTGRLTLNNGDVVKLRITPGANTSITFEHFALMLGNHQ